MEDSGKIIVTGAVGQIGSELIPLLRQTYGNNNVVAVGKWTKCRFTSSSVLICSLILHCESSRGKICIPSVLGHK